MATSFEGAVVEPKKVRFQGRVEQHNIRSLLVCEHCLFEPAQEFFCSVFIVRVVHQALQGPLGEQVRGIAGQPTRVWSACRLGQLGFRGGNRRLPVNKDMAEVRFTLCQEALFSFLHLGILWQALLSCTAL